MSTSKRPFARTIVAIIALAALTGLAPVRASDAGNRQAVVPPSADRPDGATPDATPFGRGGSMTLPPEQGCLTSCVYCTLVRPDLPAGALCPVCRGRKTFFQPAQMMDEASSFARMAAELSEASLAEQRFTMSARTQTPEDAKRLRDELLTTLRHLDIYGFDPRRHLADVIRRVEDDYGLGPKGASGR